MKDWHMPIKAETNYSHYGVTCRLVFRLINQLFTINSQKIERNVQGNVSRFIFCLTVAQTHTFIVAYKQDPHI